MNLGKTLLPVQCGKVFLLFAQSWMSPTVPFRVVRIGIVEPDQQTTPHEVAEQCDSHVAKCQSDIDTVPQSFDGKEDRVSHRVLKAEEGEKQD